MSKITCLGPKLQISDLYTVTVLSILGVIGFTGKYLNNETSKTVLLPNLPWFRRTFSILFICPYKYSV